MARATKKGNGKDKEHARRNLRAKSDQALTPWEARFCHNRVAHPDWPAADCARHAAVPAENPRDWASSALRRAPIKAYIAWLRDQAVDQAARMKGGEPRLPTPAEPAGVPDGVPAPAEVVQGQIVISKHPRMVLDASASAMAQADLLLLRCDLATASMDDWTVIRQRVDPKTGALVFENDQPVWDTFVSPEKGLRAGKGHHVKSLKWEDGAWTIKLIDSERERDAVGRYLGMEDNPIGDANAKRKELVEKLKRLGPGTLREVYALFMQQGRETPVIDYDRRAEEEAPAGG